MRLKEKKLLQKFAATLKKFSAQGAKKVEYGMFKGVLIDRFVKCYDSYSPLAPKMQKAFQEFSQKW